MGGERRCSQPGRNIQISECLERCSRGQTVAKQGLKSEPGIFSHWNSWKWNTACWSVNAEYCQIGEWSVWYYRTSNILFKTILRLACTKHVIMLRFLLLNFVCPRQHTTAFVPSSGRIYSFGLGGNGQLGTGTTSNRKSPFTVKGNWLPYSTQCPITTGKQHLAYLLLGFPFLYNVLKVLRFKLRMNYNHFLLNQLIFTVLYSLKVCFCCRWYMLACVVGLGPLLAL